MGFVESTARGLAASVAVSVTLSVTPEKTYISRSTRHRSACSRALTNAPVCVAMEGVDITASTLTTLSLPAPVSTHDDNEAGFALSEAGEEAEAEAEAGTMTPLCSSMAARALPRDEACTSMRVMVWTSDVSIGERREAARGAVEMRYDDDDEEEGEEEDEEDEDVEEVIWDDDPAPAA